MNSKLIPDSNLKKKQSEKKKFAMQYELTDYLKSDRKVTRLVVVHILEVCSQFKNLPLPTMQYEINLLHQMYSHHHQRPCFH